MIQSDDDIESTQSQTQPAISEREDLIIIPGGCLTSKKVRGNYLITNEYKENRSAQNRDKIKDWKLPKKQEKLSHCGTLIQIHQCSCWEYILHHMEITKIKLYTCKKRKPRGQRL